MEPVRHIVTAPGKDPVEFFAPEDADDGQLQQLASQALSQAFAGESFVTPVLDAATRKSLERAPRKLTQDEILARQGELTSREPSLRDRDIEGLTSVLSGLGMGDRAMAKATGFVNDIYDWTPVGSVEAANEAVTDAGGGRYLDAAGNALMAGVDVIPEVGTGASALAMILGRNAKTANLDMLRKAERMAEQGIDRRQIYDETIGGPGQTGWYQGVDGQWRFEISDEGLKVKDPVTGQKAATAAANAKAKELGYKDANAIPWTKFDDLAAVRKAGTDGWNSVINGQPLRDAVSFPELEAAYPIEFNEMTVRPMSKAETKGGSVGNYNPSTGQIRWKTTGRKAEEKRSTVAHELMHGVVQDPEGFAGGSLVGRAGSVEAGPYYKSAVDQRDWIQRMLDDPNVSDISKIQLRRNLREAEKKIGEAAQYEGYRRVAGEVEARNVQSRLGMTIDERRATPPWETQDIPDEEQFVVFRGEGMQADMGEPVGGPGKQAMATAKALSKMAGSPAGGGKKLTTRQIKKLSEDYLRQVEQGAAGAPWYEQSGRSMMFHMGEREPLAIKFAGATGITSSQTPVLTNLEHAVRGHNQAMMGDPVRTGMFPTAMGKDIEGIYAAPDMSLDQLRNLEDASQFGMKRTPFIQQNLMYEGFEPGQQSTARAVHDIWDMRARGYQGVDGKPFSTSVSPAQHRWADIQDQGYLLPEANYRMLGGRADWDTGRAQAAAWVGNKIDALMKEGKTFAEAQQIAITDYSHGFDRLYANHSWESAPGSNTGHMAGFDDLPWEAKKEYHSEAETAFLNPEGQSNIALGYGLPTGRSYDTTGMYEGVVSPGTQDQIAVARGTGSPFIDPSSAKGMDAVAATQGLLGAQKAAAWNFQDPAKSSIKNATGFRFDMDRTLSLEDIERFGPMIQEAFPGGNVGLLPDPAGMKIVSFGGVPENALGALAKRMQLEGGLKKPFPTTQSGNYMENAWDTPEGRFGGQYVNVLRGLDIPGMEKKFDSFAPTIASRMLEIDPILMKEAGLTGSADIERLRKTIANEGWQGLVKLVESQKGSVDAKAALLAALAGLAGVGAGGLIPDEAQQ